MALAGLMFTLSDNGAGGIDVVGTGSGSITADKTDDTWEINKFQVDFIEDSFGTSIRHANTVTGTLTNTSTMVSVPVTQFSLDRDTGSMLEDDIRFKTDSIAFLTDHTFTFSLNATFDSSNAAFSDLIPGMTLDLGGGSDEIFGTTSLTVVPEPSAFLTSAMLGLFLLRRRKTTRLS